MTSQHEVKTEWDKYDARSEAHSMVYEAEHLTEIGASGSQIAEAVEDAYGAWEDEYGVEFAELALALYRLGRAENKAGINSTVVLAGDIDKLCEQVK